MIVHVNHLQPGFGPRASELLATLLALVDAGRCEARLLPALRVHLDWVQYRANFREPVAVRRARDERGRPLALAELAVDLRQEAPDGLRVALAAALAALGDDTPPARRVYLDEFRPLAETLIWSFNRLFWQRVVDWERAAGRGFEDALPSGRSDAAHPEAVAADVADFWTLLLDLDKRGALPAEIFVLEIGVGSGQRAAFWLDRFRALDDERGTGFYARLRFLLGDYSLPTLDRAMAATARHRDTVSMIALDALNPMKALAFLKYKILQIHLTNVYDNLPADEMVRRDGRLYLVEARPWLALADVEAIATEAGLAAAALPEAVARLLDVGPDLFGDRARGTAFWRRVWGALRLDERLIALDGAIPATLPPGLDQHHLEDLLQGAPDDVRFHVSRGAAESFVHTLPLLHPRGYLQVQDIFVTAMDDYRHGFRGPGKLDGSVVNWVNGPLLRAAAARAGYDVHFAPFRWRPGSRTSILYTTQRD